MNLSVYHPFDGDGPCQNYEKDDKLVTIITKGNHMELEREGADGPDL